MIKFFWIVFICGGLFMIVLSLLAEMATREFAKPPRRALEDYHFDWLDHPTSHGIRYQSVELLDDRVPCLVVEPDSSGQLGKRGKILRQQLEERKLDVPGVGEISGQVIILHGRNGRKEDMLPIAERFCAAGYRCLLPDMPGHGESKIAHSHFGGNDFDRTMVVNIFAEARSRNLADDLPCALVGISMGGAFAIRAAEKDAEFYCATIICSFDNLEKVIDQGCRSRMGPLASMFKKMVLKNAKLKTGLDVGSIRPCDWAKNVTIPVLSVHGVEDRVITKSRGRELHEAFGSTRKKWVEVPGAGHDDILTTPMRVFATIIEWQQRSHEYRTPAS